MTQGRVVKNFSYLAASNVVGQMLTLWGFVRIARILGPDSFGHFVFAQTVSLYFLYLADFGLQTRGTREVAQCAQNNSEIGQLVGRITLLRIVTALVAFLILLITTVFIPKSDDVHRTILIFGLSVFPSAILLEWVFQGMEQMKPVAIGRVLRGCLFAGLVFFFVESEDDLDNAALYYVLGILGSSFLLLTWYLKTSPPWGGLHGITFRGLRETFLSAFPFAIGAFITQVNYNFGTFTLGLFLSDRQVGLFSASYKIILFMWAFVVVAASNAILPLFVRMHSGDIEKDGVTARKIAEYFLFLGIAIGIGGAALGDRLIQFLYPAAYGESLIVLQTGIWIVTIVMLRVVFENALIARGDEGAYSKGFLIAGALTLGGNLALVKVFSILCPIIVSLVAESFLLLFFLFRTKLVSFSSLLKMSIKPAFAGIIMSLAIVPLSFHVLLLIPIGALVYGTLLLLFRCISIKELLHIIQSFTN